MSARWHRIYRSWFGVMGDSRMRHLGYVHALRYSDDGKSIISSGSDGTRVWDLDTFHQTRHYPGTHLSPDGRRYALVTDDSVSLHDAESNRIIKKWSGAAANQSVAFSEDGTVFAFILWREHKLFICDAETGKERHVIHAGANYRLAIAIRPDGKAVAASDADTENEVCVFDTETGNELCSIELEGSPRSLLFNHDGGRLVVGQGAGAIQLHVFDATTGTEIGKMERPYRFAFAFDKHWQKVALAQSSPPTVEVWRTQNKLSRLDSLPLDMNGHLQCLGLSPDGQFIAVAAGEAIRIWRLRDGVEVGAGLEKTRSQPPTPSAPEFVVIPDGNRVIAAAYESLDFWETSANSPHRDKSVQVFDSTSIYNRPSNLDLSPDGELILFTKSNTTDLSIWNIVTGEQVLHLGQANMPFFVDNNRLMALSGNNRLPLLLFDVRTGLRIKTAQFSNEFNTTSSWHSGRRCISSLNSGKYVIFSDSNSFRAVDVETGTISYENTKIAPSDLCVSPSDHLIASVRSGYTFDASTGDMIADVDLEGSGVDGAFSPDSSNLAVIGSDGVVNIANARSGAIIKRIPVSDYPINNAFIAYAPDGRHLLVSLPNGAIYILRLEEFARPLN